MTDEILLWCGNGQLADGNPRVNPTDQGKGVVEELTPNGEHELDVIPRLNALAPDVFDRYTKSAQFAIKVGREHASFQAAMDFYLRHAEELPGRASLVIGIIQGGVTYLYTSTGSGWRGVTQKPTGLFTVTEYQVVRGERFVASTDDPEVSTGLVVDGGTFGDGYASQAVLDGGHYGDLPEPVGSPHLDGGSY